MVSGALNTGVNLGRIKGLRYVALATNSAELEPGRKKYKNVEERVTAMGLTGLDFIANTCGLHTTHFLDAGMRVRESIDRHGRGDDRGDVVNGMGKGFPALSVASWCSLS